MVCRKIWLKVYNCAVSVPMLVTSMLYVVPPYNISTARILTSLMQVTQIARHMLRGGDASIHDAEQGYWLLRGSVAKLFYLSLLELACLFLVGSTYTDGLRGIDRNWAEATVLLWKLVSKLPKSYRNRFIVDPTKIIAAMLGVEGALVEIHGLSKAPHLNHKRAIIIAQPPNPKHDDVEEHLPLRIRVQIEGDSSTKSIRPYNLTPLAPMKPWAEPFSDFDDQIDASEDSACDAVWEYAVEGRGVVWKRYPLRIELDLETLYSQERPSGVIDAESQFVVQGWVPPLRGSWLVIGRFFLK